MLIDKIIRFVLISYKISVWKKFLKHRKEIFDGIKHNVVPTKSIRFIAKYRMSICKSCEHYSYNKQDCLIPGTEPCCKLCGCSLDLKTYSLSSSCPMNKWTQIISEEKDINLIY